MTDEAVDERDGRMERYLSTTRLAAIVLCGVVACYFTLIAAYALMNAEDFASDMPRLLRYVFVPLGIAGFLALGGLVLPATTGRDIGIVAVSVLTTLFLFETYLTVRTFPSELGLVGYAANEQSEKQYRSGLPPTYTLKALSNELGAANVSEAALSGLPGAHVLLCTNGGKPVSYLADHYGFRNPDEVYDRPVDVMVFGDSFTEGICLHDGDDLVSRLRIHDAGTVGAGTRGAGPLFELAMLGRYGPVLKPRHTVIAFFGGNDWENLFFEKNLPYLRPALGDTDFGPVSPDRVTRERTRSILDEWWAEDTRTVGSIFESKRIIRNFFALQKTALVLGLHYPKASEDQPVYDRILQRARQIAETWQGDVMVAYIPPVDRFVGLFDASFAYDGLRDRVRESAERSNVGFLDLTEVFVNEASDPRSFYAANAHFNERGAALAADAIADALALSQRARD